MRPARHRLAILVVFFLAAPLATCGTFEEKQCTLIGCVNQLSLDLSTPGGAPLVDIVGTVQLDGTTAHIDCDAQGSGAAPCSGPGTLTFFGATPAEVVIDLHRRDNSLEIITTIQPTYQTSTPNGPECGPICTQATVALTAQ